MIFSAIAFPGSESKRAIFWQAFGVISLTIGLAVAILHPVSASNASSTPRSGGAARNT
jgi:hypothetical protein